MGGSAAGAELIGGCAAERLDVPIVVHRGYGLPPTAGKHALVVASSYSGDTAEVLSAAEAALERAVPLVALTAGGRLEALAGARGVPRVKLPHGLDATHGARVSVSSRRSGSWPTRGSRSRPTRRSRKRSTS